MKRAFAFYFALILLTNTVSAQLKLDISIDKIRNNTGNIMLQFFDENENVITQEMREIKDSTCSFSLNVLKPGKYAVRYYHDENLNNRLDTNVFGKPTEGYGFSNNVTGKSGPPPFEKWLFEINADIKIELIPLY